MTPKYSNRQSRSLQARTIVLQKDLERIQRENEILRELLWLRHGCNNLYGDDGERQCGACMLDFKRDSAQEISDRFEEIGRIAMEEHFKTKDNKI